MDDRALGLHRRIHRRDFLNGVALTVGAASLPLPAWALADLEGSAPYPPARTGLRGSPEDAVAHALRDGTFWESAGTPLTTGETYDLVVVGAGISGLAAAHYFRKAAGPGARILLLDNHDDFGGHAQRNEFTVGGRLLLGFAGTYSIDSPAPYSPVAAALLAELGIDVEKHGRAYDRKLYASRGLGRSIFFDKETFGQDALVPSPVEDADSEAGEATPVDAQAWTTFLARAPLSVEAKRDLPRVYRDTRDHYPGQGAAAKKAKLARISYAEYLTGVAGFHPDVLPVLQARTHTLFGVGIDAVPAQDAWGLGLPGFLGLGLDETAGPGMNWDARPGESSAFVHFPDGNATLARLLVRALVPGAIPGSTVDDVILARADYGKLDVAGAPCRVRLSSTVARVRHVGEVPAASEVEVSYVRGGALETVRGRNVILACWHSVIPYLCPELSAAQREALAFGVKVPICYTNVALRDSVAFERLKVSAVHAPGSYWSSFNLDLPVTVGGYASARKPEEPVVVHMVRTPCSPGLPARQQHRAGRVELLTTSFEEIERTTRDQLARVLGPGGFDPARDIAGLTVNRWPHGYAYQYNSLWDPFWVEGGPQPCVAARQPWGRIAIANADSAAYSYADASIDQAWRAVADLRGKA